MVRALIRARHDGVAHLDEIVREVAVEYALPVEQTRQYFSSFSYGFGAEQRDSLSEFIHYAYYFGILPDALEIRFFAADTLPGQKN